MEGMNFREYDSLKVYAEKCKFSEILYQLSFH